jgi:hypothetical protein
MEFRRSDLQEAFFVPGRHAFRVYGYRTTDPLEEVLAPGYFAHGTGLLRPGDLIYVSSCPAQAHGGAAPRGPRRPWSWRGRTSASSRWPRARCARSRTSA